MSLPIITLNLNKICQIAGQDNFPIWGAYSRVASAREYVYGWGYTILYDHACKNARSVGLNLDSYLTAQIAFYMSNFGERKSPVMVWYSLVNFRGGMIFLYITSCHKCKTMSVENSEDIHVQELLRLDAEPFMYYDGTNIFRVHWHHGEVEDFSCSHLLCDLGAIFPGRTGYGDESAYDRIVKSPLDNQNICYSPVSSQTYSLYEWKGKKMEINHAFCLFDSGI